MSQFDILVLMLLGVSAAVGFFRGAVREVFALMALVVAAALAVLGLPAFGPTVRGVVQPDWLGTVASLVLVFVVAFIALRLIGAGLAQRVQKTQMLGFLDRSLGLLIGLGRGLIVLGALFLMFNAATPEDLRPQWITGARTWPLASNMGRLLDELAPKGLDVAGRLKPAFQRAIDDGSGDRTATGRYEAREPDTDRPERPR
ncbi:CvpA family protein [Phenylobacterium kunshanense]|uniref:CvpA family protein n=1 Tax=Phenylobacterium kunshanense TaxID=1445034 RepID=A0A328BU98_9CAUL|nr:CvpA family protein [Phenylobacterium kunshanense]RAK68618.1 CvpA family protein [Phenylobacterium kunshanense]